MVLAILEGPLALYKVGKRLAARGLVELLHAAFPRAARHDNR